MRFIRGIGSGLRLDLRSGMLKNIYLMISPFLLGLLFFQEFVIRSGQLVREGKAVMSQATMGDCWLYVYGGMQKYNPVDGRPFEFPVTWTVIFLLGTFLVLHYPFKDMAGSGQQILVRMGGRAEWWLSKCIWAIISMLYYHGMILLTLFLRCWGSGFVISREIDHSLICTLFDIWNVKVTLPNNQIPVGWLILPICMAVAAVLLQMMLALFLKPLIAFIIMAVMYLASAYLFNPWVPGNYAMPLRGEWFYKGGMQILTGYRMAVVIVVISVLTGLYKFRKHYDIIGRD